MFNAKAHLASLAIRAIHVALTSQDVRLECHDRFVTLRFGNQIIFQADASDAIAILKLMGGEE